MPLSALASGWAARLEKVASALLESQQLALPGGPPHLLAARVAAILPRLCQYLDLLVTWNQRVDLTAARSEDELVDLVLCDALVLALAGSRTHERWVDVGSGAGAPGLPLALLRPDVSVSLVEPKAKRVAFLRTSAGSLALPNVSVIRSRSQALPDASFQVAVSRATLPPARWLAEGSRLASAQVWLLLARGEAPFLSGWRLRDDRAYRWPLTGVERRLFGYEAMPC